MPLDLLVNIELPKAENGYRDGLTRCWERLLRLRQWKTRIISRMPRMVKTTPMAIAAFDLTCIVLVVLAGSLPGGETGNGLHDM